MSIYSTMDITREDALREIERNLRNATDEQVEDMLFAMTRDWNSYNFRIVANYEGDWSIKYNERGLQTGEGK